VGIDPEIEVKNEGHVKMNLEEKVVTILNEFIQWWDSVWPADCIKV